MGSYHEIETYWTFVDIMEANEVLDIKEDIERTMLLKKEGVRK